MVMGTYRTARVELPHEAEKHADATSDSEDDVEEGTGQGGGGDPLSDLPDETEDLDLVHSGISALENLRLARFAGHLKRLCLRQNFISFLDPAVFNQLTLLEELDLYDNKLKAVGDSLNSLSNLSVLDLSFNLLKAIPDTLEHLTALKTVYFVQNRISTISGLQGLGATLRSLELGGNKLRQIENLDALVNLEELWLGKNKITKLENLGNLKRLKILALQSNRLTKIEEELYLSHNGVQKLEGLQHNLRLTTLDVGNNFISTIENLSYLRSLAELWINNNKIPNLQSLESQLAPLPCLETIYLEGNPCQQAEGANYRRKIMLALPKIKQIDATYIPHK
ncbi:hypothetical protein HETIRDRAFT_126398 [Heterobasidion irregulare TC 32-1]|uniref:U2A'/phosphoprotein 32 family A C-terminal domain-containing protein n=1 Tax=Heterobasidion irregulare (strain TC 32-1) TaxID=747525 RepID=W4KBH4_HETIT|nr:uncharacterized protein HETIRDRAFT_126398 [Heterobasidion irregulare TC 32-1]ETW83079.1 hypothetical protein HETIRDRAFT_126398 [Heterobasidion irregulare TC 32-1]